MRQLHDPHDSDMDKQSHTLQRHGMGASMTRRGLRSILDSYLTRAVRSTTSQPARNAGSWRRGLVLSGVLCVFVVGNTESVHAAGKTKDITTTREDAFKLYAHSRIINFEEFSCFVKLIEKENSTWNPKARNGSHYGIGQMKNPKYNNLDGYRQIDWTLRYITKRYQTVCSAWTFFKARGYH